MLTVPVAVLIVPEPSVTPPLVNAMLPVVPIGTLAIIVTELPNMLGPEAVTVTTGVALLITCTKVALEVLLFESPLYVAVTVTEPVGKAVVVTVATPLDKAGEPKMVDPAVKVTVPVTFAGSAAVKVTDWLATEGFTEDESVTVGDTLFTVCVVDPVAELLVASPL